MVEGIPRAMHSARKVEKDLVFESQYMGLDWVCSPDTWVQGAPQMGLEYSLCTRMAGNMFYRDIH